MTFNNRHAGMLIYTLNALSEQDPEFTTTAAVKAGEDGLISVVIARARGHDIDVSSLELHFAGDPIALAEVNDLYSRWTNASDAGNFGLSTTANGWIWLSSISVNVFLVIPYGRMIAPMG